MAANLERNIELTLTINGKQLTATLSAADGQFQNVIAKAEKLAQIVGTPQRASMLDSFAQELTQVDLSADGAVASVQEFITVNQLTEKEVSQVIQLLRKESETLGMGSNEYKKHKAAVDTLNLSYQKVNQSGMTVNRTGGMMTQTLGQLGFAIGDADMFFMNFRMGMMSVANNIPMVAQGFMYAAQNAKLMGTTIKAELIASLTGAGGLLLAINGLMFLLNVLPRLFDETTEEVKKQADEVKKLREEYDKLSTSALKSQIKHLENQNELLEGEKKIIEQRKVLFGATKATQFTKFASDEDEAEYERLTNEIIKNNDKIQASNDALAANFQKVQLIYDSFDHLSTPNKVKDAIEALDREVSDSTFDSAQQKKAIQFRDSLQQMLDSKTKANDKLFEAQRAELEETFRHQQAISKIYEHSDVEVIQEKISFYKQMIDLYNEFGKKNIKLHHELQEAEAEFNKLTIKTRKPDAQPTDEYEMQKITNERIEELDRKHQETLQRSAFVTLQEKLGYIYQERDAIANSLGQIASVFAKHTVAYQAFAKAQALIDTYTSAEAAFKAMAGIPIVGPVLGYAAAAAAIVAGLARVEQIGKVQTPGYALGGRLPAGKPGYIEGTHNEIIAPEKTFIELYRQELRPQIYAGNNNSELLKEVTGLRKEIKGMREDMRSGLIRTYLDNREAQRIVNAGNYRNGRSN